MDIYFSLSLKLLFTFKFNYGIIKGKILTTGKIYEIDFEIKTFRLSILLTLSSTILYFHLKDIAF